MRHPISMYLSSLLQPLLITGLCLFATLVLYHYYQWQEGYWLVWAAVIFSLITFDHRLHHRLVVIGCTGLLAATSAYIALIASSNEWLLSSYLFAITFACVFFAGFNPSFFLLCFFINFFSNISGGLHADVNHGLQRYGFLLSGIAIAIFVHVICWVGLKRQFLILRKKFYIAVMNLGDALFSCLLQKEYSIKGNEYEERILVWKRRVFSLLIKLETVATSVDVKHNTKKLALVQRMQSLCELILDLGRLRYQIGDQTIFDVCGKELQAISISIQEVLYLLISPLSDRSALICMQQNIDMFAETYRAALEVVAHEPVVFFLFIEKLQLLYELLNDLIKEGV